MPRTKKGHKNKLHVKRQLRKGMTPAENILWTRLRAKNIRGLKFRRQHGIGPYITDFYCPEKKLVIEVDGDVHAFDEQKKKDSGREDYFESLGLEIIRYTNNDIMHNIEGVLEDLFGRLR